MKRCKCKKLYTVSIEVRVSLADEPDEWLQIVAAVDVKARSHRKAIVKASDDAGFDQFANVWNGMLYRATVLDHGMNLEADYAGHLNWRPRIQVCDQKVIRPLI